MEEDLLWRNQSRHDLSTLFVHLLFHQLKLNNEKEEQKCELISSWLLSCHRWPDFLFSLSAGQQLMTGKAFFFKNEFSFRPSTVSFLFNSWWTIGKKTFIFNRRKLISFPIIKEKVMWPSLRAHLVTLFLFNNGRKWMEIVSIIIFLFSFFLLQENIERK